jgi:hypothetical protein
VLEGCEEAKTTTHPKLQTAPCLNRQVAQGVN